MAGEFLTELQTLRAHARARAEIVCVLRHAAQGQPPADDLAGLLATMA